MSAVIRLADYRAERARSKFIRELADELDALADTREGVLYMAGYYEAMGWADASDIGAALLLLGLRKGETR